MVAPDRAATVALFRELYGTAEDGWLAVFRTDPDLTDWIRVDDLDLAAATVEKRTAAGANVYFGLGLHPKNLGIHQRGKADSVAAIPGLYMDVDIGGPPAHKQTALPQTIREALDLIGAAVPLAPTIVVDSGHGLHAYWLMKEVWAFASKDEHDLAAALNASLQRLVKTAALQRGWKLDTTSDLSRVLRPAGTINVKPDLPPKMVRVVHETGLRYTLDEFEEYLPTEDVAHRADRKPYEGDNAPSASWPRIVAGCGYLRHCRDDAKTLTEPEWHAMMTVVARCVAGEDLAHDLSKPYPAYDDDETQKKFEYALKEDKPFKCATIRHDRGGEAYCSACPSWGTIASPIVLGMPKVTVGGKRTGENDSPPTDDEHDPDDDAAQDRQETQGGANGGDGGNDPGDPTADATDDDEESEPTDLGTRLHHRAKASPGSFVGEVLGEDKTIGALARKAEHDAPAWNAWLLHLRDAGVKAGDVARLEKVVNGLLRKASRDEAKKRFRVVGDTEQQPLPRVKDALPSAPVGPEAVVPAGYRLSATGILHDHENDEGEVKTAQVAPAPVLVAGRLVSIADETESLRLAWSRDGRWRHATATRATVMNSRQLVDLADRGLPVTSRSASDLTTFLAAYEALNLAVIPRANVSSYLGWQGDRGELGFLWGKTILRADGSAAADIDFDHLAPEDWREDWVAFHGADAGDAQIAGAFRAEGSLDSWRAGMELIAPYPRVRFGLYASLAAAMLEILDVPTFIVDWCGVTSQGKTTVLRVAASAWGCPDPTAQASVMGTWNATRVYIERRASLMNGIPVLLDDSKQAKNREAVGQAIYDLTSGQGRGRGSPQGIRHAGSWRTVVLSTGEMPAVAHTQDGGTRARVLTLWGPPFGKADEATAKTVNKLIHGLSLHYGHAGPAFVRYLLTHRDEWKDWRKAYRATLGLYLDRAAGNAVAGRIAGYLAAIDLTAAIAHQAIDLPWPYQDPVDPLWDALTTEATGADRAAVALGLVLSWANGNEFAFYGREHRDNDYNPKLPMKGWLGKWESGSQWDAIAFLPHALEDFLKSQDLDVDAVLRTWRDRGWLDCSDDRKRFKKLVRFADDKRPWCYVVKRSAFDALSGSQGDE